MKKILSTMVVMMSFLWLFGSNCHAQGLVKISNNNKKVIYVVYDNSSSMFKDDGNAGEYTDRWVQADYALRALALMMNEGDILRPYIMGDYKDGAGISIKNMVSISQNKEATLSALESIMNRMAFTNQTYFQGVEAAVNGLSSQETRGKDCWIIILTDGQFTRPDKIDNGDILKAKLEEITEAHSKVSIAYVPIGKCDIIFEEDRSKRLYTATGNNILEQVTQVVNLIYGRVQLDESIRNEHIQKSDSDGKLYIANMDIPIEKMIVLLQDAEPAAKHAEIEDLTEKLSKKIINKTPSTTEAFRYESEISFTGRATIPGVDVPGGIRSYDTDLIRYSILRGMVYDFKGNGNYAIDMQNEYVAIDVTSDAYETVDVYYQPAIFVQADYYQNGELVEHGAECLSTSDNSLSERCIRAGDLTVELYMTDSNGNRIKHQDSDLLYGDSFEVELHTAGGRSVPVQAVDGYRYQFEVEEGNYTLNILTSWNESYMKEIEVQEPVLPLKLEFMNEKKIWIDQPREDGSVFAVRLWEGDEIVTPASVEKIELTCSIQDKNFCLEELGPQGNGIWKFRITLADYEQHQITESIQCYIKAVRRYESGTAKPVEAYADESYTLNIVSDPFELSVEPQLDSLTHWVTRLFWGEDIPIIYACNGRELTAKQKEGGLSITEFRVEPSSMQKYFRMDKYGNLHLKGGLFGVFSGRYQSEEIGVTMIVGYEHYNTVESLLYDHTFTVTYIPVWAKLCIYILLVFVFMWVLLCILKRRTNYFIPKYRVNLNTAKGGVPSKVLLKRKGNIINPFCKTAHLVFKESQGVGDSYINGFDMKITNNFSGEGWRIVNYGNFSDKIYRIDGRPVNMDNCVFSDKKVFSVQDRRGRQKILTLDK